MGKVMTVSVLVPPQLFNYMKNPQKGSAAPLVIAFIAVLALGALFVYSRHRVTVNSKEIPLSESSMPASFHPGVNNFFDGIFNDVNYGFSLEVPSGFYCSGFTALNKENEYPFLNPEMRCSKNGHIYNQPQPTSTEAIELTVTQIPSSYTEQQVPSIYGESDFKEYGTKGIYEKYKPIVGQSTTFASQPAYYREYQMQSDSDFEIYEGPLSVIEYVFPYHGYYYMIRGEALVPNFNSVKAELKTAIESLTFNR